MLKTKLRTLETDKIWDAPLAGDKYADHVFLRVGAKEIHFSKVDFRYSVFDGCYLRNCNFDTCDFTGCRFLGTNFHSSSFTGCKFDYASFERTLIDNDVLDTCCPPFENLKSRFARTLRMNYQGIGDAASSKRRYLLSSKLPEFTSTRPGAAMSHITARSTLAGTECGRFLRGSDSGYSSFSGETARSRKDWCFQSFSC